MKRREHNHQLEYDELKRYVFSHVIASSSGIDGTKRLLMIVSGPNVMYEVKRGRAVAIETADLAQAVAEYNRAPGA